MQNQMHPSYIKGLEALKKDRHQIALTAFNEAIEAEPEIPEYYSDRGVTFFHLDDKEKALADMEKALELEPEYGYRYSTRAFIRDSMGDTAGAAEDYRRAVELDPEDSIALNNLGLIEEKLGYMNMAKRRFDQADTLADGQPFDEKSDDAERARQKAAAEAAPKPTGVKLEPRNLEKETKAEFETEQADRKSVGAHVRIMLEVFRKKETFKDFLRFLKNGFKQPNK